MRRFVIAMTVSMAMFGSSGPVLAAGPPQGPVHLALGNSQAFGIGVPQEDKLGYVAVLNRWVHATDCREGTPAGCPLLELVNLSVPGATSSSLIANQLQPAVALIADRNTDTDTGNDVTLITLTIGGNDLLGPVVDNCSGGLTPACAQVIQNVFNTYATNLALILGTLRSVAGPDTQIVVMTYDNPLGACFLAPLEPLGDVVLEGGPGVVSRVAS